MITLKIEDQVIETNPIVLNELIKQYGFDDKIVGANFACKLRDLNYKIKQDGTLDFIYKGSIIDARMRERSLTFLLIAATKSLFKEAEVYVEHSFAAGLYCHIIKDTPLSVMDIDKIRHKMQQMINAKLPINRKVVKLEAAIAHFESIGLNEKAELLTQRKSKLCSIYSLDGIDDYFYGVMYKDLSYIDNFSLMPYDNGVWLASKNEFIDSPKLFKVFEQFNEWGKQIGVNNISQVNRKILNNEFDELILMSEAMIEKNLASLANKIARSSPLRKLVLIAGPSSAGKTTFSKRLSIQLKILGIKPVILSLDDFYRNKDETYPLLPDGSYDFENIEALDIDYFTKTIYALLNGEAVQLPHYDFVEGVRKLSPTTTSLGEDEILIFEGIHGLNPRMSEMFPDELKFKIYINALTFLNLDNHNRIQTRDYRLIRRMARDYQFRNYSARQTIKAWANVMAGEDKYIYPYQEEANYIFNTSMVYELCILKTIVVPLLKDIKADEKEYVEAFRLRKLLSYFVDGDKQHIPNNSILAEFIGNSIFF